MDKSYKFRLYPTKAQQEQIERTFGCCRFVYNRFLALGLERRKSDGSPMNFRSCLFGLKELRNTNDWLRLVNTAALKNSLNELCLNFNIAAEKANAAKNAEEASAADKSFPRMRLKKSTHQHYKVNRAWVNAEDQTARIPGLGAVPCRVSRKPEEQAFSANIYRLATGYYIVLNCADTEQHKLPKTGKSCVASVPNAFADDRDAKRIDRLKRRLSRKQKDSRNREKLNLRIQKMIERKENRENDRFHKLTSELIRENDVIKIGGELPIRFVEQLRYKAKRYGRRLQVA
jgi:putative transposase